MGFEIAYDPAINLKVVKAVKKYPVLYDHKKYAAVEIKEIMEQAWAQVALEIGISENDCKSRWSMIKSCYKRYLNYKIRNEKTKPYYLSHYLYFLLPFMNIKRLGENAQHISNLIEEGKSSHTHEDKDVTQDVNLQMNVGNEFELKLVDSSGKEESFFISTSNQSEDLIGNYNDQSADWDFFSSLLPDVRRMDKEQKKRFRNALLSAVDTVLYGEDI